VLFDGVCNLCNASVNFVIDRDPGAVFHFASLQSEAGRALLAGFGREVPEGDPDTVFLVEDGALFDRSTAVLRIARRLRGWPRMLVVFRLVPRVVRDAVYGFLARRRYRLFGRSEACRVPTKALKARFLDAA